MVKKLFSKHCAVNAFGRKVQLETDGRERGLWLSLADDSAPRTRANRRVFDDRFELFIDNLIQLGIVKRGSIDIARIHGALRDSFDVIERPEPQSALLEWPDVKKLYNAVNKCITHKTKRSNKQ